MLQTCRAASVLLSVAVFPITFIVLNPTAGLRTRLCMHVRVEVSGIIAPIPDKAEASSV